MAKLFGGYFASKKKAAWNYIEEWQGVLYSGIVFGATMVVMFWASVFLYTSFYFTYMPQESVTWPIHFRYDSCGEKPGICSNPQAVVSVTDPVRGSLLARGQKYRVVIDVEMPESPANQRLGMFLVNMSMKSHGGEMMRQSARSAMLRYRSSLLQFFDTTLFAPLLLYGFQEEKQMVTVELFSQYEEDPVTPLSEVHVELTTRHIEFYSSQLRIHAMFSGLRYFMYQYPLTAATVGIGICMVFLSAVVILSWYQFSGTDVSSQFNIRPTTFPNGKALPVSTDVMKSTGRKGDDKTASGSRGKKGEDSNQLPEAERRDSDEFEVVSPTKMGDGEADKQSRSSSEADSVVDSVLRHRVQNIPPTATVLDE